MIGTRAFVVLDVFLSVIITKHSVSNIMINDKSVKTRACSGGEKAGYTEDDHREQGQHALKCY